MNFGLLFRQLNFSATDISHTFYWSAKKFGNTGGWPIETHSLNFVNFGEGVPCMVPCGDMRTCSSLM